MPQQRVRVWDLPTRIFHWLLAVCVVFSFVSAKIGGAWTEWHFRSGYAILTLLVFRLLWGFAGNRNARFSSFVRGPRAVLEYVRVGRADAGNGHNPLGGWSVIAMLAALSVQATAGLFANDAIASEGPLAKLVSASVSDRLATLHRWGEKLLIALVGLHVGAVLYYRFASGDDRITPMLTGDRPGGPPARDDGLLRLRALLFVAIAAGFVGWIVGL